MFPTMQYQPFARSRLCLLALVFCYSVSIVRSSNPNGDIKAHVEKWRKDPVKTRSEFGHISFWDTSNVTSMRNLFSFDERFNEDISMWNVSAVTDFSSMFWGASSFDRDLGNWDVSSAQDMQCMFCDAKSFRGQGLENWKDKVNKVTSMFNMFEGSNIQTDLSVWNVSSVTNFRSMFMNTPMYDVQLCWKEFDPSAYSKMHDMFNSSGACLDKDCAPIVALEAAGCSSASSWVASTTLGMTLLAGFVCLVQFL